MISQKIRLYPNEEQKKYLRDRFHYSRYVYNEMLGRAKSILEENKNKPKEEWQKFNIRLIRDWKKANKEEWEKEYSNMIIEATSENLESAFSKFFDKTNKSKFPKFKTKKNNKMSFLLMRKTET